MPRTTPAAIRDTWRVYQTMFVDHLESANAAPRTIQTYGLAVEQLGEFLRKHGMPSDPTRVPREHLVEWMRYLQRPVADGGRGVLAQSALQRYRSVSRLFAWLVATDEIVESPMSKMTPPKVPEKLVPVIKPDDLRRLLKATGGTGFEERRDRAIVSLFIDTGLRIAEMASIRVEDVDFDEREVTVMGKGRRARTVRFVKETRSDLQRYMLRRVQHPHAEDEWPWLGKRGQLTSNGIYQMVQRRCEDAGIERVHPHMFRHTFAHEYLLAGGAEASMWRRYYSTCAESGTISSITARIPTGRKSASAIWSRMRYRNAS